LASCGTCDKFKINFKVNAQLFLKKWKSIDNESLEELSSFIEIWSFDRYEGVDHLKTFAKEPVIGPELWRATCAYVEVSNPKVKLIKSSESVYLTIIR
jgi:hypothetical protein